MQNLTIYLLRDEFKSAHDAVAKDAAHFPIAHESGALGDLFVKPNPPKSPKWTKLFAGYVSLSQLGKSQSTSAVFITKVKGRLFALTFGQGGRFILSQESVEERFGLLVTLNSVKRDSLRSIDKHTFDTVDQNSRVQVSQQSSADDFGLDIERDLVKGIVGQPTRTELGSRFSGTDALTTTVSSDLDIKGIRKLLRKYLKRFQSDEYKKDFAWIDQIHQVRRKGARERELNELLIQKLNVAREHNGIVDGCWITIPEVVDWKFIAGFKFTKSKREGRSTDLHLPGFVQTLKAEDVLSIEFLRARYAYAVNDDDIEMERWTVFKCLHCELEHEEVDYILSGGHWFAIDKDFVKSVTRFFDEFPRYDKPLLVYDHKDEASYNKGFVENGDGQYVLMDAKPIIVGGLYDRVEFCDVYSLEKEMFHIKRYGNSNVLGHLFNQGLVSGELLRSDARYPELVNKKLPATHYLFNDIEVPRDVATYSIIFCIITQSKKDLHVPFFARVAFKNVCQRLSSVGYKKIFLSKIECSDDVVLVKKLPSKIEK